MKNISIIFTVILVVVLAIVSINLNNKLNYLEPQVEVYEEYAQAKMKYNEAQKTLHTNYFEECPEMYKSEEYQKMLICKDRYEKAVTEVLSITGYHL